MIETRRWPMMIYQAYLESETGLWKKLTGNEDFVYGQESMKKIGKSYIQPNTKRQKGSVKKKEFFS